MSVRANDVAARRQTSYDLAQVRRTEDELNVEPYQPHPTA